MSFILKLDARVWLDILAVSARPRHVPGEISSFLHNTGRTITISYATFCFCRKRSRTQPSAPPPSGKTNPRAPDQVKATFEAVIEVTKGAAAKSLV
jgi:hypothetical protein